MFDLQCTKAKSNMTHALSHISVPTACPQHGNLPCSVRAGKAAVQLHLASALLGIVGFDLLHMVYIPLLPSGTNILKRASARGDVS